MTDYGFTTVAAITVICYLIAAGIKATSLDNKWLPVICGALGGLLGSFAYKIMPGYPATDLITAIAVGIVSGFAATGVNQVMKQMSNSSNQSSSDDSKGS